MHRHVTAEYDNAQVIDQTLTTDTPEVTVVRRPFDSSKTRVAPIFDALMRSDPTGGAWIGHLPDLCSADGASRPWTREDLTVRTTRWSPSEIGLHPPVALLSWLIRHVEPSAAGLVPKGEVADKRKRLAARDPETVSAALAELRKSGSRKGWHVLEGPSCPDVFIETTDAIIVIEGKRTERDRTTKTAFMSGRDQMLRHLDAAWEIRGNRSVYGALVVEAEPGSTAVPARWSQAAEMTRNEATIRSSFPHRSSDEATAIAECFVGVTTWHAIDECFGLNILPIKGEASL
jgi:hypothetical protein